MALFTAGTFTGNYHCSSSADLARADFVIGHEFAAPETEGENGVVNEAIAEIIAERYAGKRIYAAETIARAIRVIAPEIELAGVFEGVSSDTTASQGGSWGELQQAKAMAGDDLRNPILVGQANHMSRVALQARKADLDPLLPAGLPTMFDPDSSQWWCRGPLRWTAREIPGTLVLRHRGQI